jgi:hypothetical protein
MYRKNRTLDVQEINPKQNMREFLLRYHPGKQQGDLLSKKDRLSPPS